MFHKDLKRVLEGYHAGFGARGGYRFHRVVPDLGKRFARILVVSGLRGFGVWS